MLERLAFQPLSAPQVAATLQIHPRTARRLVVRLHAQGYLTRSNDARRRYAPSMRIVGQIIARSPLTTAARPLVARLGEDTGFVERTADFQKVARDAGTQPMPTLSCRATRRAACS